ncbi:MAG: DUF4479 domain-containing protein [Bacilli bacterium]|jgi:tRNA-binding EMAP/Myf-like protein|nr:DUF4479 domain-containing protein [Bacilli bacterium]
MYRLFYNHPITGDILFVLIDPEKKADRHERKGRVEALYCHDDLVGINIFAVSEVFHLKASGIIFAPSQELLDVVNAMIGEASLAPLPPCLDSGYEVAEIVGLEEHPLDERAHIVTLSLGERTLSTVSWFPNLEIGKSVVVALEGTILYDGTVFHAFVSRNIPNECSICASKELKLADEPGAFFAEGYVPGEDFFLGGH